MSVGGYQWRIVRFGQQVKSVCKRPNGYYAWKRVPDRESNSVLGVPAEIKSPYLRKWDGVDDARRVQGL